MEHFTIMTLLILVTYLLTRKEDKGYPGTHYREPKD